MLLVLQEFGCDEYSSGACQGPWREQWAEIAKMAGIYPKLLLAKIADCKNQWATAAFQPSLLAILAFLAIVTMGTRCPHLS
ncbi:MAG TPA: hypothetical protein VFP59_06750 [Candidatus Angelobacter sp.]|nr:hypothetical protein [Candidatus Angelobacter sp.]